MSQMKKEEKAVSRIRKIFHEGGMERGKRIEEIARGMHPDSLATIPLYRSCVVVTRQSPDDQENGCCTLILYHDPGWMGQEINSETLGGFKDTLQLHGQRSGFDLLLNGGILTIDMKKTTEMTTEEEKEGR